jgi:hypothetical protein
MIEIRNSGKSRDDNCNAGGKRNISAASDTNVKTEDAMFSILPVLGSGKVNMFPQQLISMQQERNS